MKGENFIKTQIFSSKFFATLPSPCIYKICPTTWKKLITTNQTPQLHHLCLFFNLFPYLYSNCCWLFAKNNHSWKKSSFETLVINTNNYYFANDLLVIWLEVKVLESLHCIGVQFWFDLVSSWKISWSKKLKFQSEAKMKKQNEKKNSFLMEN